MPTHRNHARISFFAAALVITLVVCLGTAVSAERKKRDILLSEGDDARIGREAAKSVPAQMGLYEDPELEAYVDKLGQRLLRGVPRMGFNYKFKIVDQFEPNAFALPGGYIFISRGLLALANSEDELANVMGHEIIHAAHRHAAMQQALVGTGPFAMPWARAATMAGYGRDMERDADKGGQALAAAAGYDPMGMSTFMKQLAQLERIRIGTVRQSRFIDTHPGANERAAVNAARSHEIRRKNVPGLGDTRTSYLRRLEGLPVGPRPEGGVFDDDRFLQPDMDFQLRFPPGWNVSNSTQAVGAVSPKRDAMIFLKADQPEGDPEQAAADFVIKTSQDFPVDVVRSGPVKIGGIDAWRIELKGSGRARGVTANVTFIPYRGATFQITGVAPSAAARTYRGRMLSTARSFRSLSEEDRLKISGNQIHLVTAQAGETLEELGRRSGNTWNISALAAYNGIFTTHRFEGGELVKTTRTEPYRSPTE
ncbi:MAG: M48 family metalloprotease [Deltaproteobacteria bacterium]|nr:M48 family metalloprotease [Deltaproteobacteria bacterium]